jgi:hypothetical protein
MANRIPFPYAIPDEYVVAKVPEKTRIFAELDPSFGGKATYKFGAGQQSEYYKHYQESRFAITRKKGGWDCLRHYEILMNGCIPVFEGLEHCPSKTMYFFPKDLVTAACRELLPWDSSKEDRYKMYVERLLAHCRQHCTVSAMTRWFFSNMPALPSNPKILLLMCARGENYTRELFSVGLRRALGSNFVDYPKNEVLYDSCDLSTKYGNGFTYGGLLHDETPIDRSDIEERIKRHEFDCVIYGPIGHDEGGMGWYPNMPFISDVRQAYTSSEIVFLYGGDGMQDMPTPENHYTRHILLHEKIATCFVRELTDPANP